MGDVVLSRREFVQLMSERFSVPSDISRMLKYVEGVFVLSDNEDAPVYVFEIGRRTGPDTLVIIDALMKQMNIAACFIPAKQVKYLGKLTVASMGMKDRVREFKQRVRELAKKIEALGATDDER